MGCVEYERTERSPRRSAAEQFLSYLLETAPVETAPVETAPVETAPVETAPVETVPA
jgi:hypothetical protein